MSDSVCLDRDDVSKQLPCDHPRAIVRAPAQSPDDAVKWLALLLRQAFLLVVAGIERRYGLSRVDHNAARDTLKAK